MFLEGTMDSIIIIIIIIHSSHTGFGECDVLLPVMLHKMVMLVKSAIFWDVTISTVREVCEVYEVLMIVTEDHYPLGCAPVWYKSTHVTEGDAALLGFFQQ